MHIVSFTEMSEKISSEKIVGFLNDMFSQFDDLTETYGVEKIKTIGDSYTVSYTHLTLPTILLV